jgi:hypothetical protein
VTKIRFKPPANTRLVTIPNLMIYLDNLAKEQDPSLTDDDLVEIHWRHKEGVRKYQIKCLKSATRPKPFGMSAEEWNKRRKR